MARPSHTPYRKNTLYECGGKTGVQKAWPSKALPITFRMENKGKWGLSALVNGGAFAARHDKEKRGRHMSLEGK